MTDTTPLEIETIQYTLVTIDNQMNQAMDNMGDAMAIINRLRLERSELRAVRHQLQQQEEADSPDRPSPPGGGG